VGDAVGKVHGAVDGIDDPASWGAGVAAGAFLAEDGDVRERPSQKTLDEELAADVEFEFDIVA
jgi:hypothetical protein